MQFIAVSACGGLGTGTSAAGAQVKWSGTETGRRAGERGEAGGEHLMYHPPFAPSRVKVSDIAGLRHGSHCTGNSGRSPEGIEKEGDQMVRNQ